MRRHPALYPLSWGHHHGLRWALHLKREAPGSSPQGLTALATRLEQFWKADLKAHFSAEEDLLLVRLADTPDSKSARERTLKDHATLKNQLNRIRELSARQDHKELAPEPTPAQEPEDQAQAQAQAEPPAEGPARARARAHAHALTQALLEFAARLDQHISYEEHELFPLCEQALDEAGLEEVGRALVEAGVGQGQPVLPEILNRSG